MNGFKYSFGRGVFIICSLII